MALKMTKKTKTFLYRKMFKGLGIDKKKYIETPILISQNWQVEFHVHTDASLLVVGFMVFQNVTRNSDQLVMNASRLLNKAKQSYNITKKEALAMIFALHKNIHYLLGNKFVFYVAHVALIYLVNKP